MCRVGVATWQQSQRAWTTLAMAVASAAEQAAYRRWELAVIALLAASLVGGFAVEAWRARAPAGLEHLEAERPRLGVPPRAPRLRSGPSSRDRPSRRPTESARIRDAEPRPTPDSPLDLNRATAAELARLPGIGPRLAARILARREALDGRFGSADDLATVSGVGARKALRLRPLVRASPETLSTVDALDPLEPWEPR
ncbi:MAG: ComEA family DNA-binding protein [Candidatus Rokuibacteriota bacterium]